MRPSPNFLRPVITTALINLFLISHASSLSPEAVTPSSFAASQFDVIIIGGGTTGLVLANRLTSPPSPLRVGVIDAGSYNSSGDPLIDIPNSPGTFLGEPNATLIGNPKYDWMLESVPQPALDGLTISYPRGKVLGGSTAINAMAWQRGARAEYDAWESTFGNGDDWTFDAMLPYFEQVETWTHPPTGSSALVPNPPSNATSNINPLLASVQGENGLIKSSYDSYDTQLDTPLTESSVNLGFPLNSNPDDGDSTYLPLHGITRSVDPGSGKRSYAASGYYTADVRSRENLMVLTGAVVSRVIWDNSTVGTKAIKATGVEYVVGNVSYVVNTTKEVIICAGSLKSPQILELSGVGNASLLEGLGIPVTLDLPQVGENLLDHPLSASDFSLKEGVLSLDQLVYNQTYLAEQQALYSTSHSGAFTYTTQVTGSFPVQSLVSPSEYTQMRAELDAELSSMNGTLTPLQNAQHNILKQWLDSGVIGWVMPTMVPSGGVASTRQANTSYITVAVYQLHEFARGSVHINTTNPLASPLIDPGFLSLQWDLDVQTHALQFLRKLLEAEPIANLIDQPVTPPSSVQNDAQWAQYAKSTVGTTNHPIGTTAMASQNLGGVVSPRLQVYGLQNVRVVDAGVIPLTVGAPIQQTVYAIAEKAARMIAEDLAVS